jgi:hypothetical protein
MSYTELKAYVGAPDMDDAFVESCYDDAVAIVEDAIGTSDVPTQVRQRCYLEAGSELYHRRNAPNGVQQLATFEGGNSAIRIARDPLTGVYPLIRRYIRGVG